MSTDLEQWLDTPEDGGTPADLPFLALEDTFVSGDRTGHRFRIRYYRDRQDNRLLGKILFGAGAQGPPDHVHGGAMAAILDESMGGVAWQSGHPVVAAQSGRHFPANAAGDHALHRRNGDRFGRRTQNYNPRAYCAIASARPFTPKARLCLSCWMSAICRGCRVGPTPSSNA